MTEKETFGPEQLKAWRDRLGWTQEQAADALVLPIASYRNLEYGRWSASALWGPLSHMTLLIEIHGPLVPVRERLHRRKRDRTRAAAS